MKVSKLEVGQVVNTHGVRGELKIQPWADGPEFLRQFSSFLLDGQAVPVENCRVQKGFALVKLKGVDTMEAAQALRGKVLSVNREDAPKDLLFVAELMGMEVFSQGQKLGLLTEVLDYPGNKVYVVKGAHEYLIPAVKQFILSVDVEQNRMDVALLEGMRSDED